MTKIINCKCESAYQDKLYGKGRRVANVGIRGVHCTVCCPRKRYNSQAQVTQRLVAAQA